LFVGVFDIQQAEDTFPWLNAGDARFESLAVDFIFLQTKNKFEQRICSLLSAIVSNFLPLALETISFALHLNADI